MDFPNNYQIDADEFSIVEIDGTEKDRAVSGKLRLRRMWPESRFEIRFKLFGLTPDEVANLRSFYRDNKFGTVVWTDPFSGEQYDCQMLGPPVIADVMPDHASMIFELEGTLVDE